MLPIPQPLPTDIPITPAPWFLRGDGYVFFYRFEESFVQQQQLIPPELRASWRGGVGAMTWMNYHVSQVGPYREVMFIPGRFLAPGVKKPQHMITRIFVDSWPSVVSGRANWGIPKFYADFSFEREGNTETLTASADGETFARVQVEPQLLKLAVNTQLCPVTLMQRLNGQVYRTPLRMESRLSLMTVNSVWGDGQLFPALQHATPLGAVKLINFRVFFPVPKVEPDPDPAMASVQW